MFPGPHFVSLRKAPAWRETAGDIPEWSEPRAVCPHSTHRDPEETTNSRGLGNTPVHGGRLRGALHHGDATGLMENKTHHLPEGSTHKRLYRLRFRLPCGFFLQRHREIDIFVFWVKCFNNYWTGRRLNFGTKRNAPFRMNWTKKMCHKSNMMNYPIPAMPRIYQSVLCTTLCLGQTVVSREGGNLRD